MNHRILDPIRRSPEYAGIQDAIRRGGGEPLSVFGMPEISKIPLVITTYLEQKRPMLLICPNDYMAQRLYAAMSPVLPGDLFSACPGLQFYPGGGQPGAKGSADSSPYRFSGRRALPCAGRGGWRSGLPFSSIGLLQITDHRP